MRPVDLTLALLKPHVMKHPFAKIDIENKIIERGLRILKSKPINFTQEIAEKFYSEHKGRFFFNRLITFMTSGPSHALIIAGPDAIVKWRELMGPTKVYKAQFTHPNSIRGIYGLSDTRNATHGSDSPEAASREIRVLFPEYSLSDIAKEATT